MELIKYEDISPKIFEKYHYDFNTYVRKCKKCKEVFILKDENNIIEIYEYINNIEVYFDRCMNKNFARQIDFIENNFRKKIIMLISVKNKCLYKFIDYLNKRGYGCPKIIVKSKNNTMFKTPKLRLKQNCLDNDPHNMKKIIDEIEKSFHINHKFDFYKKDLIYLKSLLDLPNETAGEIKKKGQNLYSINYKSITKGNEGSVDMEPKPYSFHTHPKSVYIDAERGNSFVSWFSGVDIKYVTGNIPHGMKEHFLVTIEGIYRLKPTQKFVEEYKGLNSTNQGKVLKKLYKMFGDLEKERETDINANTNKLNASNIRTFNDFFVTINSVNSSLVKKLKGDYTLFDVSFKFWKDFKS